MYIAGCGKCRVSEPLITAWLELKSVAKLLP